MNLTKQKIRALKSSIRWLIPLAEMSIGAYPPEEMGKLRKGIKIAKYLLRHIK